MVALSFSRALVRAPVGSVLPAPDIERMREPLTRLVGQRHAARILEKTGMPGVTRMPPDELSSAAGVPQSIAKRVVAARDLALACTPAPPVIKSSAEALAALPPGFATLETEVLLGFALTANLGLKGTVLLAKGHDIGTSVPLRSVFVPLVRLAAASFILAHNHPSSTATPSPEDITLTRRLFEAGKVVGIDLLDHLIVTPSGTASFADLGLMSVL
jgi:DNA repair protein RadC